MYYVCAPFAAVLLNCVTMHVLIPLVLYTMCSVCIAAEIHVQYY